MKSLKNLLILGPGPSSSHTIGPFRISHRFLADSASLMPVRYEVTLLGSLGLTGKGHGTDRIIRQAFEGKDVKVFFDPRLKGLTHPNTMELVAYGKDGTVFKERFLSIGGGAYQLEGGSYSPLEVYPFNTFGEMKKSLAANHLASIYDAILSLEGEDIYAYGEKMLLTSFATLEKGLKTNGILPGPLHLKAVSGEILAKAKGIYDPADNRDMLLTAFAYAIAESNARGEMIVTSPTCGAAGVVPAVLYYEYRYRNKTVPELVKAYLSGALVCNFIKGNASISGALLGCQAEIGSASSFASASLCVLNNLSLHQIEYGAEVAMEHFLGLTCDPVDGYVQIPCIERNGMAAIHSYASYLFSKNIAPFRRNRVSFDDVVEAMKQTGSEIPSDLKETGLGGLAKVLGKEELK